ncbi:amidohydrolase family protein [Rhabdothermincola salaria]|uniref:amidohydrolase family protein n=1 Tax=Rhabdothermincola salaria TaxID=2903142 RepID=UPI001E4E09B7|nr:amidohydrolase family protein [Rhabdothermincola salaria]MCD9624077.1 amidohydrolase [Rhabdothermincola salaria]
MSDEMRVFDADNHYYEALDAFTRHIEPEYAKRAMQWAEVNGRQMLLVGGKINRFIPNPTFDRLSAPGSLEQYFRGNNPKGDSVKDLFGELEPCDPAYRDREIRLKTMDQLGIEGALFFPTLGVGMEMALRDDLPAARAAFRAFNKWMDEDWGFAYEERIFAVPYLTLSDVDNAIEQLEWVLERDARVILLQTGPVLTAEGMKSPADPRFDPFWAKVQESGVTVAYHGGGNAYMDLITMWGEGAEMEAHRFEPLRAALSHDAVADTFAALILHGLMGRFPHIRFATIETGADWVAPLLKRLGKLYSQTPKAFAEDPREVFKRNVWVSPFYENDLAALRGIMGSDHLLLGSDWPHTEGLADPHSFTDDLTEAGYPEDEQRLIMYDNCKSLVQRRPA